MNGVMNENQLTVVKVYNYYKPLIQKIGCLRDNCFRECHNNNNFHTFGLLCVYDINFTKIANSETVNLPKVDKNMSLYKLSQKLKIARENC